jgi:hypothetical protein
VSILKFKKVIIISFILICFCITSFITGMKYSSNRKLNQDRKHYINHFYFQLDNTIHLLSSVDDWEGSIHNTDVTVNPYRQLLTNLNAMKALNEQGAWYMTNDESSYFLLGLTESFRLIEASVGGGISLNNQLLCDDFLKDGILSKNEVLFLISLKQDLESMKKNLYSEETKQENPNLTMKELSKAVKTFTDKYSIYNLHSIGLKN